MVEQTRTELVAKEIVAYTQINPGNTADCVSFAQGVIKKYFLERKTPLRKANF